MALEQKTTLLISEDDVRRVFEGNELSAVELVESALMKRRAGKVLFPDKTSLIFDPVIQDRINCMPAAITGDGVAAVKWVAVFPRNPRSGLPNVTGTIILSELEHGTTLAVMGASALTTFRTAAVGTTAAKYLAVEEPKKVGFIGAGAEARMHLDMLKAMFPSIIECGVAATGTSSAEFAAIKSKQYPGIAIEDCSDNLGRAVSGADIIVTATSAQAPLLKAKWIKNGAMYIHVAGWEDEFAVAKRADKIVCDDWSAVRHRGSQTLSRMFAAGELTDDDIYCELDQLVAGELPGRVSDDEFTYFNSVGLSFIDVQFAEYVYNRCLELGIGTIFDF